jgi:hypothetical protein
VDITCELAEEGVGHVIALGNILTPFKLPQNLIRFRAISLTFSIKDLPSIITREESKAVITNLLSLRSNDSHGSPANTSKKQQESFCLAFEYTAPSQETVYESVISTALDSEDNRLFTKGGQQTHAKRKRIYVKKIAVKAKQLKPIVLQLSQGKCSTNGHIKHNARYVHVP